MKKENKNLILWLVIGVLVVLALVLISIFSIDKTEKRKPLTENDFEILSVGWDDYLMEWNNAGKYVKKIPNEEIDWKNQCNYCETGKWLGMETDYSELIPKKERCTTTASHITLKASRNFTYNFAVNGNDVDKLTEPNKGGSVLNEGIDIHGISSNLNIEKDNELVYCASESFYDYNIKSWNEEFICDSITLPAKCPSN
ncbi:MAG: hypothetical protein AABY06_02375 [Nanoarchaeota archaeon]